MPEIRPSSELRNNYPEISNMCKNEGPVFLTVNGKGDTVLMSVRDYDRVFAEYFLSEKLNEAADDIANGRVYTHEEVFGELRAKARKLKDGLKNEIHS